MPILVPGLVSVLVVFLTFRSQRRLQRMTNENQQRLQGVSQEHQRLLQQMTYDNNLKLQAESRRGTRQLEAAQKLWELLEEISTNYALHRHETAGTEAITAVPPAQKEESLEGIADLIRQQGFFLSKTSAAQLVEIRARLENEQGSLAALYALLQETRKTLNQELGFGF